MIGSLLVTLMNDNCINWDEHFHMVLYVYRTTFKVTIGHILSQLVYGLYLLIQMEYLLPMNNSHPDLDFSPTCIVTSYMAELEHLDETCQEATKRTGIRQWNTTLWAQQNHKIKTFFYGGHNSLVPKKQKGTHQKKFKQWFGSYKINIVPQQYCTFHQYQQV